MSIFEQWVPHGHCYNWTPDVLWMNVIGDAGTFLAYVLIPLEFLKAAYYLASRYPPFRKILIWTSWFIFLCGISHAIDIVVVWIPYYRIQGLERLILAAVSLWTWRVIRKSELKKTRLEVYSLPSGEEAVDIVLPRVNHENHNS